MCMWACRNNPCLILAWEKKPPASVTIDKEGPLVSGRPQHQLLGPHSPLLSWNSYREL